MTERRKQDSEWWVKFFHFLPLLLLCHCAQTPPPPERTLVPGTFYTAENASTDLSKVSVPVLRSSALERRWGKPKVRVLADGSYQLYYTKPNDEFESLSVFGSPEVFPTPAQPPAYQESYGPRMIQPAWLGSHSISGTPIRYAQSSDLSGADPIEYATETIRLTSPTGRTGSYRIIASSNLEETAAPAYIKTVKW